MKPSWKTTLTRPTPAIACVGLAAVVFLFFYPILPTYFLADDYNYVGHLLVNARQYVQGEQSGKWFIDFSAQGLQNPELSIFFRPVVQWLWLTDFVAWGTDATGYHMTNVTLHALNSFLVYILTLQILRYSQAFTSLPSSVPNQARTVNAYDRAGALAAGLLFALHPIHADSVSWIADRTDVLSAFFYFLSAIFFVFFRQRSRQLYGWLSIVAFALAIGTKENTVALPIVLLAYDALFNFSAQRWRILQAQIPYWLVLLVYVGLRFLFFQQFGRNTGGGFLSFGAGLFFQFYVMALAQPFVADMNNLLLLFILALMAVVITMYRKRKEVWLGVLWIAISFVPATSAAYVAPRLVYTPSAGLAIALAAIFLQPLARRTNLSRAMGMGLLLILLVAYGFGVASRIDDWAAAGTVAAVIPAETQRLHPTLLPDSRLYYTGVPEILRGIYIYNENFSTAIQIAYKNPYLSVRHVGKFPILSDNLERTFFLEYYRRKITERPDLLRALEARQRCLLVSSPAITWDFSSDVHGWEAWNQLTPFQVREGALLTRALGDDPYMGGPTIDIPATLIGIIEIEMQVRADAPTIQGAIFWLTADQPDFSPLQQASFPVQTDGAFHTYRVDIARDGKLAIGDRIVRLRLDPVQVPAEIALKSIRVNIHCTRVEGESCKCPQ